MIQQLRDKQKNGDGCHHQPSLMLVHFIQAVVNNSTANTRCVYRGDART